MAEYIDKHEAYLLLKDLEAAYIYPPVREAYGTAARRIDQMKAADVQPVDRWISVNDKLPEQDEKVLVLTKDKDIMTMIYKVIPFRWYKPKFGGFDKDYVTHWKPLKDGDTE